MLTPLLLITSGHLSIDMLSLIIRNYPV